MGAILGGVFSPYFSEFWRHHFAKKMASAEAVSIEKLSRIEHCSSELRDLALQFWNSSADDLGPQNSELRARVVGLQHELGYLVAQVFGLEHTARQNVLAIQSELFDSVSGGEFDDPARQRDAPRLADVCSREARFRCLVRDLFLT